MTGWSEVRSVEVRLSTFSGDLGVRVPFELPFDREYWLSIQIEDEIELLERAPLGLAGFEREFIRSGHGAIPMKAQMN